MLSFPELNEVSVCELNELLMELEAQIKENSEVLIAELAHRDELDYEKELKNSFISHLLAVQTKRRQHNLDRKKNKAGNGNLGGGSGATSAGTANGNNGNMSGEKTSPNGIMQSKVSVVERIEAFDFMNSLSLISPVCGCFASIKPYPDLNKTVSHPYETRISFSSRFTFRFRLHS